MEKIDLERVFDRRFDDTNDNWRTLCPFHDESKASFLIHKTDLVGYCFGCGTGGTVDYLAARFLHTSIEEARRELGITVSDTLGRARRRKDQPTGPKYYPESWLAPWKKEVHKYVIQRGFEIGVLRSAGTLYDVCSQRQVFPHRDRKGRLLGVTGRACEGQEPKWYHYWGYDKGQALYRPFTIDPLRPLILVEGVFDLLWLHQQGVDNVAALLGSRATVRQVHEIVSSTTEAVLGLDNDDAGRRGANEIGRALRQNIKVKYIEWPEGVKDWMDLNGDQARDTARKGRSRISKELKRGPRQTSTNTNYKESQVRTAPNARSALTT